MTLRLSLAEARAEVKLLKVKMYKHGCSCRPDIFQELLDHLCLLLKFIEFKEKEEIKVRRAKRPPPPWSPQIQTAPNHKVFFKGQNNQK